MIRSVCRLTIYRAQNPETLSREEFGTPRSQTPKKSYEARRVTKIVDFQTFLSTFGLLFWLFVGVRGPGIARLLSVDLFETFRGCRAWVL